MLNEVHLEIVVYSVHWVLLIIHLYLYLVLISINIIISKTIKTA
jgi:hypothetical protein